MQTMQDIINDLNLLIADVETAKISTSAKAELDHFTRAIGQLKAARTSLINLVQSKEATCPKSM